jgi:hypothetical protein
MNLPPEVAHQLHQYGDFGCVKFIKQVAAEYDFNIAATKSDVFKFLERNNAGFDIILPIHLTPWIKRFFEKLYY